MAGVVAAIAAFAMGGSAQAAERLTEREARNATRVTARADYKPARVYVPLCIREGRLRMRCRVTAFYDSGYCSAWYKVRETKTEYLMRGPLLERC